MAAKRTIDPTNSTAGLAFVGVRLSETQLNHLDKLGEHLGMSRSSVIRSLISWKVDELELRDNG